MGAWNPWRALRERDHIALRLDRLPGRILGLYVPRGDRAEIIIDSRLLRRERSAVLAHELVHDERGPVAWEGTPHAWRVVMKREEHAVDREVARRLVPPGQLADFVYRRVDSGLVVELDDVAEEFDVAEWVALLAMKMLSGR